MKSVYRWAKVLLGCFMLWFVACDTDSGAADDSDDDTDSVFDEDSATEPDGDTETNAVDSQSDTSIDSANDTAMEYPDDVIVDARDGEVYRFVTVHGTDWLAENLRYNSDNSRCYVVSAEDCGADGRLYTALEARAGAPATESVPSGVQGVCPEGWHLPSDGEWEALAVAIAEQTEGAEKDDFGSWSLVGEKLKSTTGWDNSTYATNGTDDYGFNGLPSGMAYDTGVAENKGFVSQWLSATVRQADNAVYLRTLSSAADSLGRTRWSSDFFYSVRCVRD